MASIGRVKPYVFTGVEPDPNTVVLSAPGFPPPQDQPQPSDMYVNKVDPDNYIFWVFGFVQNSNTPGWVLVGSGGNSVGPPGPTGPEGPQGVPGPIGATGAQGSPGSQGPVGPQGVPGPVGPQGATGTSGGKWFSGTGPPSTSLGTVGDWYLNDANGNVHEKTASTTWTLRDNLTGPQGVQGLQGVQGNPGPTGPTGPQGVQGEQGTGVSIEGVVPNSDSLPSGLGPDDAGTGYITEDDGHLWVWDGTQWTDAGQIKGPPGEPGVAGEAGPQGPQGEQGPQGVDGIQGPQGPAGADGIQGTYGTVWFTGTTAPDPEPSGARPGDLYLDVVTGDVYTLAGG